MNHTLSTILQPPADAQVEYGPSGPIWIDRNSIIFVVDEGLKEHSLEDARASVQITMRLSAGVPLPMLIDFTNVRGMRRDVREYYTSEECSVLVTAVAIMTRSSIGRMVANFFLGINKTRVPTRLFSKPEEAVNWLKTYVPQTSVA